jgi:hypothetical protein
MIQAWDVMHYSGENGCHQFCHRPLYIYVVSDGTADGHVTGTLYAHPAGHELTGIHQ